MAVKTQEIEFACPECGSERYRTEPIASDKPALVGNLRGHCNGICEPNHVRPCKFTWLREDDWEYFALVTRETFDTEEAFKTAYHALD